MFHRCHENRCFTETKLLAAKLLGVELHNPMSQRPIRRWQDRPFASVVRLVSQTNPENNLTKPLKKATTK
jgi:hypothetical protein